MHDLNLFGDSVSIVFEDAKVSLVSNGVEDYKVKVGRHFDVIFEKDNTKIT
jgi:hypothetical protein